MSYPAAIVWALLISSLFLRPGTAMMMLLTSTVLGSLTIIPVDIVGGVTILPRAAFAVLFIGKVMISQSRYFSADVLKLLRLRHLGILAIFLLLSLFVTAVMPPLFDREIVVVPIRLTLTMPQDLSAPSAANFTQSAYLMLSVAVVFATAVLANTAEFPLSLLTGVLALGVATVVTGLADIVANAVGQGDLLEPFRDASYTLIIGAEIVGARRVIGLMPEASAYGGLCVSVASALAFTWPLYPRGWRRLAAACTAAALVVMALLSTSSTAYGGLAVLAICYGINWVRRLFILTAADVRTLTSEFVIAVLAGFAVLMALLVSPETFDPLMRMIDELIFNKATTASFYERSSWNSIAWDALWGTSGLGIGIGSTRTSNWFLSIITSTGVLGAIVMAAFLIQLFLYRPDPARPFAVAVVPALKFAVIPNLVMAAVAGTTPDFGVWLAILFGAIAGLSVPNGARVLTMSARPVAAIPAIDQRLGGRARP
jgi:hypothetical protein